MKLFRFLLPLLALAGALRAQQYDNPVSIPIAYYGNGNVTYIPTGQSASFSFGASLGAVSSVSTSSAAPGSMIYSNLATTTVVPGQVYTVTVTSQYMAEVVVNFQPVGGCVYYINGNRTSSWSGGANYSFQLVVAANDDISNSLAGKRGGAFTSFPEDKPIWYIGLGDCRNGRFAGAVGFRQSSITSSLFNTSSLMCTASDTAEVSITRDGGGHITKVQSRDVVLTMDAYNPSGTSYHIYVYTPSNLTTPFMTYTIEQVTNGIEIDRLEDSITSSTQLLYSGSTWTRNDWQLYNGTNWLNQTVTTVSGSTHSVAYGSGTGSYTKTKNYTSIGAFTELASSALGASSLSAQPVTTYAYYTSSTASGWYDAVESIAKPDGSWVKYDYYNASNSTSQGLVQNVYTPWGPGTPTSLSGATIANCHYETWTYTTNYDGTTSAPSERIVYLDGTQAGDTKWTYNWSYTTANSHSIAQIAEQDYANSSTSLTTTTLAYLETDSDSFFHGKLHSVTRPDGTKDAYAYYYGTWNPTTNSFSATGSGNDRDILEFHGQSSSGSGTTYVASWTASGGESWNLDPLYLVNREV